ncbi:MAG: hypothetical protein Q8K86_02740 [Candidatus Nanopelagicaceae bacterium]|nr:hypothetical protein [Candidatus Nanopelagicaceae bacterium]
MLSRSKRKVIGSAVIFISVTLLLGLTSGAFAAAKLGGACTKPGTTTKVAGKTFICDKKNKKLVWIAAKVTTKPTPSIPANSTGKPDPNKTPDGGKLSDWPSADARYISVLPVDLTQIASISKYRSCSGHNRDGYTFDQVLETNRSLKHYFYPVAQFQGTSDKVKMFAPFDGTVASINLEANKVGGRPMNGNGIGLATLIDKAVLFQFGHIYFARAFKVGDSVKAGELIGYAALGEKEFDFDLDLLGTRPAKDGKEILGSVFDHMTSSVLAALASVGVTPLNTKETKAFRDQNPCDFSGQGQRDDRASTVNWVQLTH